MKSGAGFGPPRFFFNLQQGIPMKIKNCAWTTALLTLTLAYAEPALAGFSPIPLGKAANVGLVDGTEPGDGLGGWTDQGPDNCLNEFPTGSLTLGGILKSLT